MLVCLSLGVASGVLGAGFSHSITLVTTTRQSTPWLIYLLPIFALISVLIYKFLKVEGVGTNQVLLSASGEEELSPKLAPAVFLGSVISHLFGASVGREGAALQMGGSLASVCKKIFRLDEKQGRLLVYCGMAGLFSAVFGTPIAAFIFALEVVFVGQIQISATLPTLITSVTAYITALGLQIHPEKFELKNVPDASSSAILKTLLIAVSAAIVSIVFCYALKYAKKLFNKFFKNPYLRIAIGGIIIVGLTLLLNTRDYNGAGVDVIERIFHKGEVISYAFLLKLLFTAVAVGAGFKGGEIVPTLFIGATLGGALGLAIGLPAPFGASVGMVALFCGVTNCPLASIFLGIEMFSGQGALYIVIASLIAFGISGKISLYSAQKVKGFKGKF